MATENADIRRRIPVNGDISPKENGKFKAERDVNLQRLRDRAQRLKSEMLEQMDQQLKEMLDEFVQDVETLEAHPLSNGQTPAAKGLANWISTKSRDNLPNLKISDHLQRRKTGELPDKEFLERRSVLTELLEISHIRTIYHIFVAILVLFSLNTIVYDIIETGSMKLDFGLIRSSFDKFPIVITLWLYMTFATVLILYPSFYYWSNNRRPGPAYWVDYVWLAFYICYQLLFLIYPIRTCHANKMPPASSVVITCEQIRLIMKAHAFVRENIPQVLKYHKEKEKGDQDDTPCPNFSKYLYFLFAPTLVYRDSYPRTKTIRWNYVMTNFGQVLACLFYIYYIFERFCVPVFRHFNSDSLTPRALMLSVFGCMMPGTLVLFIAFFAILHSWLNAFAEMLKFGDRLFYKDWWNSSSFANYYRTWNIVVHDWLYSYVYKDVYRVFCSNRAAAMAAVFLLSAVFHEYILIAAFGFFYPVLFIMFAGAGFGFIFLPNKGAPRSGNVFMWVALFMGNGLLMCLYSMEWYARQNCPPTSDSFMDYLIPRSWTCDVRLSSP